MEHDLFRKPLHTFRDHALAVLNDRDLAQMCQVSQCRGDLIDHSFDPCVESGAGSVEDAGEVAELEKRIPPNPRTQKAVVQAREEQGCAEAEFGHAIAEAVGEALDKAVETQATKLIGDRPLWIDAGRSREGGEVVAQIG